MDNNHKLSKEMNTQILHLMDVILAERFGDLDVDDKACRELLEISKKENYMYGVAFAHAYLGDCLIGKNDSVNAGSHLMISKELCERNRYMDLLPYVCNWLGIYYEMQNDRQIAMHYYLDALEFAEKNKDIFRQSILYNNIASQFQSCGSYEMAKEYYIKAFDCYRKYEQSKTTDPHYAQLTANTISVCCRLKQMEEANYYYSLLEKSGQLAENQNQLYLCELLISAAEGDVIATRKNVDMLLMEMEKRPKNSHQFFETFLIVAESLITLDQEEHASKILSVLNGFCREDDYGNRLKVQYIRMLFYKKFGTKEEKGEAYEQFYELRKKSDDILNHNLAEGLLSKIKLRESTKKNEEMEKAKEQLEDEIQIDELTRIYNRRSFRKLTEQVTADPQLGSLCFIMIDVDYFKQYNDTYGHAKGDDTLRAVADSMKSASNSNIYNFRYGGDEFVSMCKNMPLEEVEEYIQSVTETLAQKKIEHSASLCSAQVTLSIGYCFSVKREGTMLDAVQMMAEADKALYWSKGQGRNCYHLFTEDMQKE